MSESTADILMKLGGYNLESRGQREVKVHVYQHIYQATNTCVCCHPPPGQGHNDHILAEGEGGFQPSPAYRGNGCVCKPARVQIDPHSIATCRGWGTPPRLGLIDYQTIYGTSFTGVKRVFHYFQTEKYSSVYTVRGTVTVQNNTRTKIQKRQAVVIS